MTRQTSGALLGLAFSIFFFSIRVHSKESSKSSELLNGQVYKVASLLKNGAKIDVTDDKGHTPLMYAVKGGPLYMVKMLLENGSPINYQAKDNHNASALSFAAANGRFKSVEFLLDNKAKVTREDAKATENKSVLHMAIHLDNAIHIVKFLLDNAVNVDVKDNHGITPLMTAASKGDLDNVKVLVKHGANVNYQAKASNSLSALHIAASHGAKRYIKDHEGRTPLQLAEKLGLVETIKLLQKKA